MKNLFKLFFSVLSLLSVSIFANAEEILVAGKPRNIISYAPTGLPKNRPLIISMHGFNQDARYQQEKAQWEAIADTAKFVVVYPDGLNRRWDISGTTDLDFITTIIDSMEQRYGIDRKRVYLSGFSMGGMMSYYAATKIADKIAAIAPVSGYPLRESNYNSSRPIPIIHVHGDADDVVIYDKLQAYLNGWITRNKCSATPQVTKPYPASKANSVAGLQYWKGGLEGAEVALITLAGKGHWYSMDTVNGVSTSAEIWNFAKRFSLNK
jgi:poly(3-hydroxybutyrate) depolymerase